MVVTDLPDAAFMGVRQLRTASPLRWTVQAPHRPIPQPYLVPVSSRVSRNTQSSGISGLTFMIRSFPLTLIVIAGIKVSPKEMSDKLQFVAFSHVHRRRATN